LEAICEQDGHGFSHGFRKGPRQPQARPEVREQCRQLHSAWSVDAEGRGCFAPLDWGQLREFVQQRGSEGGRVRLLGTWRHAGVRESGALTSPDKGAPQGGGIAPRVAKVGLPRVVDEWLVKAVPPRRQGRCLVTRCAEDVIIGCE
jgi:retron-type reverse transcriptase